MKSYQKIDHEGICSIFDPVRPVVSHLEFRLPNKPPTSKNIGKGLKISYIQFWKESLFVQYEKKINVSLPSAPTPIKSLTEGNEIFIHSLILVLIKVTVLMHGNLLNATLQMGFLRLKLLILINHTVQCNMLTHSELTLLSRLCINSLP